MKDIDGVEIYDGDILCYTLDSGEKDYLPVFFKDGCWCTGIRDVELLCDDLDPKYNFKLRVAGNIHQTPHLLPSRLNRAATITKKQRAA